MGFLESAGVALGLGAASYVVFGAVSFQEILAKQAAMRAAAPPPAPLAPPPPQKKPRRKR